MMRHGMTCRRLHSRLVKGPGHGWTAHLRMKGGKSLVPDGTLLQFADRFAGRLGLPGLLSATMSACALAMAKLRVCESSEYALTREPRGSGSDSDFMPILCHNIASARVRTEPQVLTFLGKSDKKTANTAFLGCPLCLLSRGSWVRVPAGAPVFLRKSAVFGFL